MPPRPTRSLASAFSLARNCSVPRSLIWMLASEKTVRSYRSPAGAGGATTPLHPASVKAQVPEALIRKAYRAIVTTESLPNSRSEPLSPIANPLNTGLVLAVEAVNAYRGTLLAAHVRSGLLPSRPFLYLRTMFFELLVLAIVIAGVRLRGASLQTIFGPRWRSAGRVFRELGLGVVLLLGSTFLGSILSGHQHGAPPDQSILFLIPQTSFELLLWLALSLVAGICEEAVYRGYLQRQFMAFTRSVPAGIVIAAVLFGVAHAYQGFHRAAVIAVAGTLFGFFAYWRGTVRPGMFAHTLQDAVAPLLIKLIRH
jgi:membrane protease YdiL (CAAX protease family)